MRKCLVALLIVGSFLAGSCGFNPAGTPQNQIASRHLAAGEHDAAIKMYDTALLKETKYAIGLNNRGMAYIRVNEYQRALDDLELASSTWRGYGFAHNNLGVVFHLGGDDETAERNYRRAFFLNSDLESPFFNMARVYYARQDYDLALVCVDEAIATYKVRKSKDDWEDGSYLRALILEQLGERPVESKGGEESGEQVIPAPASKPIFTQFEPSVLGK